MSPFLMTGLLTACGVMNGARPQAPGTHAVGLTVGGPMLAAAGLVLPLPNATLEGRSGLPRLLDREVDLNYGVNLTAIAFGQAGVHVGASWLLLDQQGWRPALSVSDRVYFYTNVLDRTKATREWWAATQIELTASYALGSHLLYFGAAEALDFRNPGLLLSPFVGLQAATKSDRVRFQLEGRWHAVNALPEAYNIDWISPGRGAIGVNAGVAVTLGGGE